MNTEKVFITYDKYGNEKLVYKKDNNKYFDLLDKHNKILTPDDIDTKTLIPFKLPILKEIEIRELTNLLSFLKEIEIEELTDPLSFAKSKKHMFKFNIIREYIKDRESQLDLNNIFLGKIARVSAIKNSRKTKVIDYHYIMGGYRKYYERPTIKYEFESQVVNDNVILEKYGQLFLNLIGNNIYISKSDLDSYSKNTLNQYFIPDSNEDLIPFNSIINNNYYRYMSKKSILEKYYKKMAFDKKSKVYKIVKR